MRFRTAMVALALGLAQTARAADAPVEFPLGAFVRAGRPVVVRAPGARRVRGGGSPWALPQGARGDEFVLQTPRADVTLRDVEIDRGTATEVVPVAVRTLSQRGPVRAAFEPEAGADVVLAAGGAGSERLPTIPEAWLLVDEVGDAPPTLAPDVRAALDAWRAAPRPLDDARAAFVPLAARPGGDAFDAMREVAATAPWLPADVAALLLLTALAEAVLLAFVRGRPPRARAAWLSVAPLVCLGWLVAGERLPGVVRATVVRLEGPADRLVVLRLEARRDADVSFSVSDAATTPALLRLEAGDVLAEGVEVGRDVRATIPAGQTRLFAWREPAGPAPAGAAAAPPAPALTTWAASLGLDVVPDAPRAAAPSVRGQRGFRAVEAAAVAVVATRK